MYTKRMSTIKEDIEARHKKFEERCLNNENYVDEWHVGEYVNTHNMHKNETLLSVYSFAPVSGCNLLHGDDISEILIALEIPFTLNFWSLSGRDYTYQTTICVKQKKHYITVYASGYGTGEFIVFSNNFPEKLKFNICRRIAYKLSYDNYVDARDNKHNHLHAFIIHDMIAGYVRSMKDLNDISELNSIIVNMQIYKTLKREKEVNTYSKQLEKLKNTEIYKFYENMLHRYEKCV